MNYKKLFLFAVFICSLCVIERLCHKATDGFAMVNIYAPNHKPNKDWLFALSNEKKAELDALFDQPFHYLGCGAQSYVFESEDKSVVIKFFKYHHMRVIPWIESLPILNGWKEKKREKKNREILQNFDSYFIAMTKFSAETGMIYIHLNPTNIWNKEITITDKLRIAHQVDLDGTDFLVQKRGTLAYTTINKWMESGDIESAKSGIRGLLHLARLRCEKGLRDKDPDFKTNFGFIEDSTPFQIDIGRFSEGLSSESINEEVYRITRPFREWIENAHPALIPFFDHSIREITP